ncbi:MAG: hypothetical protein MJH10_10495 [Epibacterium sp.]|nr:hypothetical protein [Epibacterium sp.]NQX73969.1 hypothetical protein [Epibacterium sp.]
MYAAGLLISAWMVTIALQGGAGALTLPIQFGILDLVLVVCFAALAGSYEARWAWWVSAFHVAMLMTHFVYQASSHADGFVYLSVLAGLGYLSMLLICVPKIPVLIKGARNGGFNFVRFAVRRAVDLALRAGQEKTGPKQ